MDLIADGLRIPKAADSFVTTGQKTLGRAYEVDAAGDQSRGVLAGCRVKPHFPIHGRGKHDWCTRGEGDRSQCVVRNATGELGDDVRCGRSDQQEVGGIRKGDMAWMP